MKKNNTQNTYIIGDVHGCFHTLQKLIAKLPGDARIIFVGDLCDKGNFSKEVMEYVISNGYECVKGNHEHLMEKYLYDAVHKEIHSPWSTDYRYGGILTYESYLSDHETMARHLAWLSALPMYIQIEQYFITHGFALPFYEYRNNRAYYNDFLLHRYEKGMDIPKTDVVNIFGHCVFDEVVSGENFYGIDTGCSYGNKLTALKLGSMQIIQEPMDSRDSTYQIKEMRLHHLAEILEASVDLSELICQIDQRFFEFDLVSSEVAEHIVSMHSEEGIKAIHEMLEKKQLFMKQAKKVIEKFEKKLHSG
ncbi:MAG: serine/threonine protein phosphatase [Campylobacterales bacterium]|nr:serine/threonine protein phosphatase [Campylobacterales bacterium]